MISSRELSGDAASFFVHFSVFLPVFFLNFVYSKCPKSFQCGHLGNLEFPLADFSQPECGLVTVQCNTIPKPLIHLDTERLSPSFEILSNISTNQALVRNPVLEVRNDETLVDEVQKDEALVDEVLKDKALCPEVPKDEDEALCPEVPKDEAL
ncbi:unnamed protein product [Fraxinus pennsylvanica]|uniref:Uncharacterized protein n=1 Tax=Fraxinus pennsylvanica TaxID=56036 RepID=A0AAD1ZZ62_9LAMI|nr:unnamed protein product [Fraxinus pennsylvanica]